MTTATTLRVAACQLAPVLPDRDATLAKVAAAVREASAQAARLAVFGEALAPAYPVWLERTDGARFEADDQKELHERYLEQAVQIERGDLAGVCEAASSGNTAVLLGVMERAPDRGGHSLYCASVFVDATGTVRNVHRKLVPTYEERLAWAPGDGHGLRVHSVGPFTVGALLCWENWMPLARAALQAQGENLHVAHWPGGEHNTRETTRFLAREGRSYCMSVSGLLRAEDIPASVPQRERIVREPGELLCNGGTCIAGPDGQWIVEPLIGEEGVLVADLDLRQVFRERQNFDPSGHYARPDVLKLSVDRRRQGNLETRDDVTDRS